jgi:hypothetical protein
MMQAEANVTFSSVELVVVQVVIDDSHGLSGEVGVSPRPTWSENEFV